MTNKPLIKKKIQKPFSIKEWQKSNAKVETKIGYPVRILCIDAQGHEPIIGLIDWEDGSDIVGRWEPDGKYYKARFSNYDLVIIEEIEEPERWAEDENATGDGYFIVQSLACVSKAIGVALNKSENFNVFATEKQAKSTIAMARISQLMKHDVRYGGVVTDEEWRNNKMVKPVLYRSQGAIARKEPIGEYHFLAFHSAEQRDLFLAENERLVKDYLMVE